MRKLTIVPIGKSRKRYTIVSAYCFIISYCHVIDTIMLFLSNIVLRNILFGLVITTSSKVNMSKPLLFIIIGIFVSLEFLQSNANAEKLKRLVK